MEPWLKTNGLRSDTGRERPGEIPCPGKRLVEELIYLTMPSIARLPSSEAEIPPQGHHGSFPVRLLCRVSCMQLGAFVLAVLGCVMSIWSSANPEWRVWQVMGSNQQGTVVIGTWSACSVQSITKEKINTVCARLNDEETIPAEILMAQDLMPLASVANAVTVLCMAFALFNIFEPGKADNFIATFFSIGAMMIFGVGTCVLISILWNLHSVLTNEGIQLPEVLEVPPLPTKQRAGISIYIGFVAAASQLISGTLVLGEKYFWEINTSKQKVLNDPESVADTEDRKPRMKTSVTLECEEENSTIWRRYKSHIKTETMP